MKNTGQKAAGEKWWHQSGWEPGMGRQAWPDMQLEVNEDEKGLCIVPCGVLKPEAVLEQVDGCMQAGPEGGHLRLDLANALNLGSMAVSALVVVLRANFRNFQSIELRGLPSWVRGQICRAISERPLGMGWIYQHGVDWIRIYPNAALVGPMA